MGKLQPVSPLGNAHADMGKPLHQSPRLQIGEAPYTHILSIRQSRKQTDAAALAACFESIGVKAPAKPNGLSGNQLLSIAWFEPRAWLVYSAQPLAPKADASLLVTSISDRLALFTVNGEGARELIAAGCDPSIVPVSGVARTRFGNLGNVIIERHTETGYRLSIDVSLAATFAAWLIQAASNQ